MGVAELFIICIVGLTIIVILFAAILSVLCDIKEIVLDNQRLVADLFDVARGVRNEIDDVIAPPAHVTDPFEKPKEVYQSTPHIVVPKTPDEIRALNYKKIQEGAEYGSAS